ncbi:MAG TPA: gamma-glutamyltransferase [Gaiellaceae bacterium]|nr:gamma-glutamyltransferase [Gaiellaceae bacterium]
MRGAVAAGHTLTAEAGARVLEAGGNAVDACIAAACVSWVCESPLTGPGGGGFMLVHHGSPGLSRLYDFFVTVPRAPGGASELLRLEIDFDGDTQQTFHTGAAAVAVPGTVLGLETVHRRFGSLPWAELVAPAARLARDGFELTPAQGYLHRILDGLLRHSPEGDAMYRGADGPLRAGERFVLPDFAATLERIAEEGAAALYRGELARRIVEHVRGGGGALTLDDLAGYRVVRRGPLAVEYRGHEFRSNPPPSSGGILIGIGLQALGGGEPDAETIVAAMEAQEALRGDAFLRSLRRGGAAKRLLSGTTHISVVDARGDAASLSASLGSGSGVVVPGTGIHLNNMLGEADLAGAARPGARLTSMMAPSLVLREGRPRLVVGSAGSARLRGAILQVVANVVGREMGVEAAVDAPRLHAEAGVVYCEDPAVGDRLEAAGREVVRFRRQNLYFGGVSAVEVLADGTLAAAGDPRRGGGGVVVK